jgi:GNAT superfamily N-acetyltransferase
MNIRPALSKEASLLTDIALAAKRHWNYPERWIELWTPLLTITPQFISAAEVWAAVLDEEIAGFYALISSGERAALEHFWILPRFMGRGVGRGLFEHALMRCREMGCQILEIESDPNAQGFYEKMGARKTRVRIGEVDGQSRVLPVLEIKM